MEVYPEGMEKTCVIDLLTMHNTLCKIRWEAKERYRCFQVVET